jgi:hypothetical protein
MVLVWVRFNLGLLQEQDFPESNLISADREGKKPDLPGANCSSMFLELHWSSPHWTASYAGEVIYRNLLIRYLKKLSMEHRA